MSDPGGPGPVEVDVDAVEGWRSVPMSESTGPVELRLLRRFSTDSMSVLVRFPAGWERAASGFYAAAELFVVLDGALQLGDLTIRAGMGAYLPAYVTRERTQTPDGALAWAHFDGLAEFVRGEDRTGADRRAGPIVSFSVDGGEPERIVARHPDGWVTSIACHPATVATGPAEVLAPTVRRWVQADDGEDLPALRGPAVVRRPEEDR